MPLPIQIGSVTQALQRAFGFKGRYTPMLDEIIVPVYVIADPSPAQITRLAAGFNNQSQVALQFVFIMLFNPEGSGILINVTSVVASADLKTDLTVSLFDDVSGVSLDGSTAWRDRRNAGRPSGLVGRSNSETAVVGESVARIQVDGTLAQTAAWEASAADPRQPLIVLDEGKGLIVQDTLGTDIPVINVNYRWLEVPITEQRPPGGLP